MAKSPHAYALSQRIFIVLGLLVLLSGLILWIDATFLQTIVIGSRNVSTQTIQEAGIILLISGVLLMVPAASVNIKHLKNEKYDERVGVLIKYRYAFLGLGALFVVTGIGIFTGNFPEPTGLSSLRSLDGLGFAIAGFALIFIEEMIYKIVEF